MSSFKDIIHGFVPEACADDDALRRDVESLLAQSISADGFLDSPAVAAAAQTISDSGSRSTFAGRQLGVCDVKTLLGAGGMDEVADAAVRRGGKARKLSRSPNVCSSTM